MGFSSAPIPSRPVPPNPTWCSCSIEPLLMRMALMPSVVSESTDWPIKNRRFTCTVVSVDLIRITITHVKQQHTHTQTHTQTKREERKKKRSPREPLSRTKNILLEHAELLHAPRNSSARENRTLRFETSSRAPLANVGRVGGGAAALSSLYLFFTPLVPNKILPIAAHAGAAMRWVFVPHTSVSTSPITPSSPAMLTPAKLSNTGFW